MSYICRLHGWPAIDTWATPTFCFFLNSTFVGKRIGWGRMVGRRCPLKKLKNNSAAREFAPPGSQQERAAGSFHID